MISNIFLLLTTANSHTGAAYAAVSCLVGIYGRQEIYVKVDGIKVLVWTHDGGVIQSGHDVEAEKNLMTFADS